MWTRQGHHRIAVVLAIALPVLVGLTRGFGSADTRATNDARQILEARLQTIGAEAASDLRGVGAGRVGPVVTEDLYLRTTGRDGSSIGNHTVSVGGCVRMRASDSDRTSSSISWTAPGRTASSRSSRGEAGLSAG